MLLPFRMRAVVHTSMQAARHGMWQQEHASWQFHTQGQVGSMASAPQPAPAVAPCTSGMGVALRHGKAVRGVRPPSMAVPGDELCPSRTPARCAQVTAVGAGWRMEDGDHACGTSAEHGSMQEALLLKQSTQSGSYADVL